VNVVPKYRNWSTSSSYIPFRTMGAILVGLIPEDITLVMAALIFIPT